MNMLPSLYSCGPAQIVLPFAVTYNLAMIGVQKVNLAWENSKQDVSHEKVKSIEESIKEDLKAVNTHLTRAIPIVGTDLEINNRINAILKDKWHQLLEFFSYENAQAIHDSWDDPEFRPYKLRGPSVSLFLACEAIFPKDFEPFASINARASKLINFMRRKNKEQFMYEWVEIGKDLTELSPFE